MELHIVWIRNFHRPAHKHHVVTCFECGSGQRSGAAGGAPAAGLLHGISAAARGAAAGGEPLTFAQLTLANGAYAAGGTARAELQGSSLYGGDWEGHVAAWDW